MRRFIGFLSVCFLLLFAHSMAYAQPDRVRERGRGGQNPQNQQQQQQQQQQNPGPGPRAQGILVSEISGTVVDETGEPMVGAYVRVKDAMVGAITNETGFFQFRLPQPQATVTIVVQYVGYANKEVAVTPANARNLSVQMAEDALQTEEVVVSASRREERQVEAPVTIEAMNLEQIRNSPSLNLYESILTLKGVDQLSSSITFKVLNTRGFNSRTNPRMVYRLDGMDMQAPGLNLPIGLLNGPGDVDAGSLELIPGAASALYGANAFNGLLNVTSRDPFQYQGLSAQIKFGVNHVDNRDYDMSPLYEAQVRYAKAFNNRFAFKVVGRALFARDWIAGDQGDASYLNGNYLNTRNTNPAMLDSLARNPGYDGINVYGDEVAQTFLPGLSFGPFALVDSTTGPIRISRDGYRELEVGNPNARALGAAATLSFRATDRLTLSATSQLSTGNTVYSAANRYQILNFVSQQHKIEAVSPNWFVRAYVSMENAGDSYDTRFAGIQTNRAWKSDEAWFQQYLFAYAPATNGILNFLRDSSLAPIRANDHDAARAFANQDNSALIPGFAQFLQGFGLDSASAWATAATLAGGSSRLVPGTAAFDRALDSIRAVPLNENGAMFTDRTWFYHAEAQYDFTKLLDNKLELTVGGSFRQFFPNSNGVIFIDSVNGPDLSVWEYGLYAQARKRVFNNRLAFQASARLDQLQNFQPVVSPRASITYTAGERRNHNIRASVQSAFRNPTLQAQFIDFDVQVFRYLGGLNSIDRGYGLMLEDGTSNAYLASSVDAYQASVAADTLDGIQHGDSTLLQKFNLTEIQPERIQSIELGYRAALFNRMSLDIVGYYNQYTNFTETYLLASQNTDSFRVNGAQRVTPEDIRTFNYSPFSRYGSSDLIFKSYGISVGVDVALTRKILLGASYTYTHLIEDFDKTQRSAISSFNTPPHKVVVTLGGRNLLKNRALGFGISYRHATAYEYGEDDFFIIIPSYNTVDAQVSYKMTKLRTEFRLGGTNILNHRYREQFGGPNLGGLYYIQINFDQLLNQ